MSTYKPTGRPPGRPRHSTELEGALDQVLMKALRDKNLKPTDRLKAIEAGIKLLAIRAKISEGSKDDESFFQSS